MTNFGLAMWVGLVGCGGDDSSGKTPDAAKAIDAAKLVDAAPTTGNAMSHTLFLNTEGVTWTLGADDATMDKTSIAVKAGSVVGYLVGDANRTTEIASIVAAVKTILAPYGATVTTTRPAAGPYDELVMTDDSSSMLGFSAGVGAVVPTTCNSTPSVMGFTFPKLESDATRRHAFAVNTLIAMFGSLNGIASSKTPKDCMCWVDMTCDPGVALCTIGGATTMTDLGNSGAEACGETGTTFDEGARFLAAFGAH